MKMMHGDCFLACSNMSRTRDAPTPTNISTKSEPEIEKNGTLASPAMALASSVLPVPGGPTISTPRGMRPPSFWNRVGSRRNSTSSSTSPLASSQPATSANVTRVWSSLSSLARERPNDIAPLLPPCCICRIMKNQKPMISSTGRKFSSRPRKVMPDSGGAWRISTLALIRSSTMRSSRRGAVVVPALPSLRANSMERSSLAMSTDWMRAARTSAMNCE